MIQVHELRIGNYVLSSFENINEVRITAHDLFMMSSDRLESFPIPISPYLLTNAGFKKDNEFDVWRLCEFDIEKDSCWWWSIDDRGDNEGSKLREIKHLHQLQNIYFLVTGNELEVKF